MVYLPAEDSFLLAKEIEKYLNNLNKTEKRKIKILDVGTGSGIQAQTAIYSGVLTKNVLAVDVDKQAIKMIKAKGIKVIESDLFSKIKKIKKRTQTFDLIVFNAPYLPEDKEEPLNSRLATTAGKKGYEIIIRFLKEAKTHLNKNGKIFLLFSSLSKPRIILSYAKKIGYKNQLLCQENLFFEKLFVYEFKV